MPPRNTYAFFKRITIKKYWITSFLLYNCLQTLNPTNNADYDQVTV